MKKVLISGGLAVFIALAGCQATNEEEARHPDNNIDRYQNTTTERWANDRNYTMERDADRYQNRDFRNVNNRFGDRTDHVQRVRNNSNENRYEIAEEAAEKITEQVAEIESAYVLTTDNNAYVAAELDTSHRNKNTNNRNRFDDEVSDEVKEKIADIVRSVDRDIENVYVSTNPDFFDLTNGYIDDVNRGEPVEGFFDQFSNMIERLFPQNR